MPDQAIGEDCDDGDLYEDMRRERWQRDRWLRKRHGRPSEGERDRKRREGVE